LTICVLALFGALATGAASAEPAAEWTRALYQREISRRLAVEAISDEAFLSVFAPATREAWLAARKGPGPSVDGPILNAFFGWGILPGQPVELAGVAPLQDDGAAARIAVDLRVKGTARRVIVEERMVSGAWRIDDIIYPEGESFLTRQRKCASGRC
jgi:hypothetical protein